MEHSLRTFHHQHYHFSVELRRDLLSGNIDAVIQSLRSQFPTTLQTHPELLVELEIQRFLDLFATHSCMSGS